MRTIMRRMATVPVAMVWAVALAGCAQDSDDEAGPRPGGQDEAVEEEAVEEGAPDDGGGGGAPGIPGNPEGGGRGAPIDIPAITNAQGQDLDSVLARLRAAIEDQCDGELCVELSVERSGEDFEECEFVSTDPPPGSTVERESTVVVIAGTEPCEDTGPSETSESSETPETSEGGTDEGSDTTEGLPDEEPEEQPEGAT